MPVSLVTTRQMCSLVHFQFHLILGEGIRMRKKDTKLSLFTDDIAKIQTSNKAFLMIRNKEVIVVIKTAEIEMSATK